MDKIIPPWINKERPQRQSTTGKAYKTNRWKKCSERFRREYPLCNRCKTQGNIKESEVVDHIVRTNAGGAMWDKRNWQTLCRGCHDWKTKAEKNGLQYPTKEGKDGLIPDRGGLKICSTIPTSTNARPTEHTQPKLQKGFHGGKIYFNQIYQRYTYDFPYFFVSSYSHSLRFANRHNGHVYQISYELTHFIDAGQIAANSKDFIKLVYDLYDLECGATEIRNVNDLGYIVDIVLITDFNHIKKIERI
jgi:5-methylcytosine-specific restriction enzyme A